MFDKIKWLAVIWFAVIFAYIVMGYTHDVWDTMSSNATAQMASQNLSSEIVGIEDMLDSSNYWKWVIPALVGMVSSVIVLREEIAERISR